MSGIAYKFLVYGPYGNNDFLNEIRSISSVQWLEDYQSAGEVRLECGASDLNLSILKLGNRIINSERPHCTAVICEVDISDNSDDAKMTVHARLSLAQWSDKVIMFTEKIENAEESMLRIASNNRRDLPCKIGVAKGLSEKLDTQKSWGDVYAALTETCQSTGLGVKVSTNTDLTETIEVYKGVDRTNINNKASYVGYFGDDIKNIKTIKLLTSEATYKNFAIVAGRGEGKDRIVVTVDWSNGCPKKELYVDGKDVPNAYQKMINDELIDVLYTQTEYEALLRAKGIEKLTECERVFSIKPTVTETVIIPGRDYDLGDILPLQIKKYGIQTAVMVQQLKFTYEQKRTVEAVLKVVTL